MLMRFEFEPKEIMQRIQSCCGSAVRERAVSQTKIWGTVVVKVCFLRNGQEHPGYLTDEQGSTVEVAHTGNVTKGMTITFIEARTSITLSEAVDTDNAHFRVRGRYLAICALQIIQTEDELRRLDAQELTAANKLLSNITHEGESTGGNSLSRLLKMTVSKIAFAVVDQTNLVNQLWGPVGVKKSISGLIECDVRMLQDSTEEAKHANIDLADLLLQVFDRLRLLSKGQALESSRDRGGATRY